MAIFKSFYPRIFARICDLENYKVIWPEYDVGHCCIVSIANGLSIKIMNILQEYTTMLP